MKASKTSPCPICGSIDRTETRADKKFCGVACVLWHAQMNCPADVNRDFLRLLADLPATDDRNQGLFTGLGGGK